MRPRRAGRSLFRSILTIIVFIFISILPGTASSGSLHGVIPPTIAELQSLEALGLTSNNFVGDLPPGLLSLPNMTFIYVSGSPLNIHFPSNISPRLSALYVPVLHVRVLDDLLAPFADHMTFSTLSSQWPCKHKLFWPDSRVPSVAENRIYVRYLVGQ